ncbi:MAG: hypothetical protein ACFFG0_18175 [Candidatus Thorarchaeota archaeon]
MEKHMICPSCLSFEVYIMKIQVVTEDSQGNILDVDDNNQSQLHCKECREDIDDFTPQKRSKEYENECYIQIKEYKINKLITLRFINNKTWIFINKKPFSGCKYLLLLNPHENKLQDSIQSIDEATRYLDNGLEHFINLKDLGITPEQEFQGHCSNLEVWVENDYNSNLLHRNLAFPLLKKLMEEGDLKARRVYKDEILKRFLSGFPPVMEYLILEGYMEIFNKEEIQELISDLDLSRMKLDRYPEIKYFLLRHRYFNIYKTGFNI